MHANQILKQSRSTESIQQNPCWKPHEWSSCNLTIYKTFVFNLDICLNSRAMLWSAESNRLTPGWVNMCPQGSQMVYSGMDLYAFSSRYF